MPFFFNLCFEFQVVSKKDRALDAKGGSNTKDIRIESFDVAYGDKYVYYKIFIPF